ncbi:MAG: hypothetical protein WC773_00610 [Patescibacteria group bacterium]|jgi:hypothetical protein
MFFNRRLKDNGTLPATKEERFWRWFSDHSDELMAVRTGRERICNQLFSEMQKVAKGIVYLFGPTVNGKREFIVTPDGIPPLIDSVQKLVNVAPDLDVWKVIAFKPRVGSITAFSIGKLNIDPNKDMYFSYNDSGGERMALKIYIDGYDSSNKAFTSLAYILLDMALGEYNVMTKLSLPELLKLPENYKEFGLIPFSELPKAFDLRFKK